VAIKCPACGALIHTPDPARDVHLMEPEGEPKPRRDKIVGAGIFAFLLIFGLWALSTAMRFDLIPAVHTRHLELPLVCVAAMAVLLVFWATGILDRR